MKRNLQILFVTTIILLVSTGIASAQTKAREIDALLRKFNEYGQFNGVALVADGGGKIIFNKGFGLANFEWKTPKAPDTKFRIGSITKVFTAILVLRLVEDGKLKLADKIGDLLPDFQNKPTGEITVNQLLTHTSGLPDYNNLPQFFREAQSGLLSETEIVRRISEHKLLFEPGAKFGYSNDGYRVLGVVVEKVSGKSYEQVLREDILAPLGMKNSGYARQSLILEKRAAGYRKRLSGLENALYYVESPASGMYSTVEDLFLFDAALDGDKLLSAKSKELMWQIFPSGNAYGWQTREENGFPVIVAEGAVFGFFARLARRPENHRTIILLTNVRGATNYLPEIEKAINRILDGKPYEQPKKSIAETLLAIINRAGVKSALGQYRELKARQPAVYNFGENELNNLGYFLLNNLQKPREAVEIFKLNAEEFPSSANVFDSLGEAYARKGDKELAVKSYQKSLELNPKNVNDAEMIKKLKQQ